MGLVPDTAVLPPIPYPYDDSPLLVQGPPKAAPREPSSVKPKRPDGPRCRYCNTIVDSGVKCRMCGASL